MMKLTYREAVREALREAILRDDRVFLMGEDVGRYGGCYAVSKGLLDELRAGADPRHAALRIDLRGGRHRGGDGWHAAHRRDHDGQLQPAGPRPDREHRGDDPATCRAGSSTVPVVIRMATGAGRQLAAQHSHSLEGWYAHIPGIKVLAPGTVEDARGMLAPALADPDPVVIFENAPSTTWRADCAGRCPWTSHGQGAASRHGYQPDHLRRARSPRHVAGGRDLLAGEGHRRGGPRPARAAAAGRADHRRLGHEVPARGDRRRSLAQRQPCRRDHRARIMEQAFYELDGPVARVCSAEVPMPYAYHLEQAALPQPEYHRRGRAAAGVRRGGRRDRVQAADLALGRGHGSWPSCSMPSLGADMEDAIPIAWPGEAAIRSSARTGHRRDRDAERRHRDRGVRAGDAHRDPRTPGQKVPGARCWHSLGSRGWDRCQEGRRATASSGWIGHQPHSRNRRRTGCALRRSSSRLTPGGALPVSPR